MRFCGNASSQRVTSRDKKNTELNRRKVELRATFIEYPVAVHGANCKHYVDTAIRTTFGER